MGSTLWKCWINPTGTLRPQILNMDRVPVILLADRRRRTGEGDQIPFQEEEYLLNQREIQEEGQSGTNALGQ